MFAANGAAILTGVRGARGYLPEASPGNKQFALVTTRVIGDVGLVMGVGSLSWLLTVSQVSELKPG